MHFTTIFSTLALVASTTATAIAVSPPNSNDLVTDDYANSVKCGQKNPAINMAIQGYCAHNPSGLEIGAPFTRGGMIHDGWKVGITGPTCPVSSKWVPAKYCEAQFHYICAVGGVDGHGWTHYGEKGCQIWSIELA